MRLAIIILLLSDAVGAGAQVRDNSRRVDTLSFAERFAVRTNIVDWALTVPNVGFEYDLRRENWNRYAINLNLRYRPETTGTFVKPIVFNIFEATVEGRMYWSERRAEANGYMRRHSSWIDKLFSCRNMAPSHPNWIFYRGAYVSYADYSLYLKRWDGWRGRAVLAGVTWGVVKPLVTFQSGNSVDMEFGLSAGLCYTQYDTYRHDYDLNAYYDTGHKGWHFKKYPVVRDVHAAVVYRFGKYPLRRKYRWRYDVDMKFREQEDHRFNERWVHREHRSIRDSLYDVVSKDFRLLYDSCVNVRHKERQESIDRRSPERKEAVEGKNARQRADARKDND